MTDREWCSAFASVLGVRGAEAAQGTQRTAGPVDLQLAVAAVREPAEASWYATHLTVGPAQ